MERGQETRAISLVGRQALSPVVVGLGANLGEPATMFRAALLELQEQRPLVGVSALYRTAPIGPEQPDFLNAAVLLDDPGDLEELLGVLQRIEQRAGRVREERWGPRVLDLDLLFAGERKISSSSLTVPHPELVHRAFALAPLVDLLPDAKMPENGPRCETILRGLEEQRCERVEGANWWEAVPSV